MAGKSGFPELTAEKPLFKETECLNWREGKKRLLLRVAFVPIPQPGLGTPWPARPARPGPGPNLSPGCLGVPRFNGGPEPKPGHSFAVRLPDPPVGPVRTFASTRVLRAGCPQKKGPNGENVGPRP